MARSHVKCCMNDGEMPFSRTHGSFMWSGGAYRSSPAFLVAKLLVVVATDKFCEVEKVRKSCDGKRTPPLNSLLS
jgi:hypothetical protein